MKNNTLHYQYREPIIHQNRVLNIPKPITCMSMRCTSRLNARRILAKKDQDNLKKVIFTDKFGIEHPLKMQKMQRVPCTPKFTKYPYN